MGEGRARHGRPHLAVGESASRQWRVQFQYDRGGHDAGGPLSCGKSRMACWIWRATCGSGRAACGVQMRSKPEFSYPYDPKDGRENPNAPDTVRRVLRGGSFRKEAQACAAPSVSGTIRTYGVDFIGFRVVSLGF